MVQNGTYLSSKHLLKANSFCYFNYVGDSELMLGIYVGITVNVMLLVRIWLLTSDHDTALRDKDYASNRHS